MAGATGGRPATRTMPSLARTPAAPRRRNPDDAPTAAPGRLRADEAMALALTALFVAGMLPFLATLAHDFDEAWLMLEARAIARGLRPFVDFAHHEMPLHPHLLALFGTVFGPNLFGYRLLSLTSAAGTGYLLFRLVRPVAGPLPALGAQAAFLFTSVHAITLLAVPETPMTFCTVLGIFLLFGSRARWAVPARGVAFVAALLIKPTMIVVIAAAVASLAYARAWRTLGTLAVSGTVAALAGLAGVMLASDGAFVDILGFHQQRLADHQAGVWAIDSGFTDMRRLRGIEHPWQLALASMETFYRWRFEWLPAILLVGSLLALPIWVVGPLRSHPALRAFAVLWPAACFLGNFAVLDFVTARYFIPFPVFSAFLAAGWVWVAERRLPRRAVAVTLAVAAIALAGRLVVAVDGNRDLWYWGRVAWIAHEYPRVLSFSPMLFAATGTEPGCGFANPALTYGGFGEALLVTDRTRRFRVSDEQLIACLRADPTMPVVVDWAFYYFTRPGSALRAYLDGEGRARRLFFSPEALAEWGRPTPRVGFFR